MESLSLLVLSINVASQVNRSLTGQCPPNAFFNYTRRECQKCDTGTFISHFSHGCAACPPGKYWKVDCYDFTTYACDDDGSCQNCGIDTYADGRTETCTHCPNGWHAPPGSSSCTYSTCSPGHYVHYNNYTHNFDCAKTSEGCYSNVITNSSDACPNSCPAQTVSLAGATSCTPCQPGTYSAKQSSECITCNPGKYFNQNSRSCEDCYANTFSTSSMDSCTNCPSGQYSPPGSISCAPATPTGAPSVSIAPSRDAVLILSAPPSSLADSNANLDLVIIAVAVGVVAGLICFLVIGMHFVYYCKSKAVVNTPEAAVTVSKKLEDEVLITEALRSSPSRHPSEYSLSMPLANPVGLDDRYNEDDINSSKGLLSLSSLMASKSHKIEVAESSTVFQIAEATDAVDVIDEEDPYAHYNAYTNSFM